MAKYIVLAAILLFAAVLYHREATAYFCGFDDLIEWHRIAFTSDPGLANDFSVNPHPGYKYRPLAWTMNRLTYELGHGSPAVFRTRNLVFHLANIALLYGIAMLLFGSRWVAATAALLWGIHPLVNQSVVGGIWTVTPSDFLVLLGLWLFLLSLRESRWRFSLLVAAMLAGWVGIVAYDAVLFFFGFPFAYLAIHFFFKRKRIVSPAYIATLTVLTVLFVGSFFALRARFLPPGRPGLTRVAVIAKNSAIYAASFTLVIDPVLANEWLGTPLPSEALRRGITPTWLLVTTVPAYCLIIFILLRWKYLRRRFRSLNSWPEMVFLLVAMAASFSPFLLFTDHASETYTYLPLAFFILLVSRIFCHLCSPEQGADHQRSWSLSYAVIMTVLVALFSCGVWVKNGRVIACGSTVSRVLTSLPGTLAHGSWHLIFADVPYEPAAQLYGMYGYKGIESLGFGDYGGGAVQEGIQSSSRIRN